LAKLVIVDEVDPAGTVTTLDAGTEVTLKDVGAGGAVGEVQVSVACPSPGVTTTSLTGKAPEYDIVTVVVVVEANQWGSSNRI
jgi:hypothetical protein